MKSLLVLILVLSCTTAPSVKKLTKENVDHKDCLKPLESVTLSPGQTVMGLFRQTAGTAGTVVATGAGVVGDTVVVTTGLAGTLYLCGRDSIFCEDILGGYVGIMEEADLLWSTKKAYRTSTPWRCPEVDHISRAFRKVSSCLHEKGEYVEAFEQLSVVEENGVMAECMSGSERGKIQELKAQLVYPQ